MSKINSLLTSRLKVATEKLSKMANLAEMSSSGNLSGFSGIFKVSELNEKESESLRMLLEEYGEEGIDVEQDYFFLSALTSEVKAINNQAAVLHGERIKKAQDILKKYKDGAFSSWLIRTYGNRQTPYNFLRYYEFYQALPGALIPKLDEMPRQAAYTLAGRDGDFALKEDLVKAYRGETKREVLDKIRRIFPLSHRDKRGRDSAGNLIKGLQRIIDFLDQNEVFFSSRQKKQTLDLLALLKTKVKEEDGTI